MKVLIMTITAGQGHNSTAKAIGDYLDSLNVENQVLDTYKYISEFLGDTFNQAYLKTSSNLKHFYGFMYGRLEKRNMNNVPLSITTITNKIFSHKLDKYIKDYNPDVIVCTHVLAAIIVNILIEKGEISAKTIAILTDFTFHPYWEEVLKLDYVITPNELLGHQAKLKGFEPSQVIPLGIPINPKFSTEISQRDARLSLGLDPDKKTVLIMSGSMGFGNIEETVLELDAIDHDFQMIIVCGNNSTAKKHIDKLETKKKILNFGYTSNVDVLMDAADCIVTKPGGLTTSEALAKNLPIIIVNPIPGQEDRNTEFLLNNGIACAATKTCTIPEIIYQLFEHPKRIDLMRECAKLIKKPNATKDLCEFIQKIAQE